MLVYAHMDRNGSEFQIFKRPEAAIAFVLKQINSLLGGKVLTKSKKPKQAVFEELVMQQPQLAPDIGLVYENHSKNPSSSEEFDRLKNYLNQVSAKPSIDGIVKAIDLYEEYSKYVMKNESFLHSLQEVKVVE
jgi:hypothetical protein